MIGSWKVRLGDEVFVMDPAKPFCGVTYCIGTVIGEEGKQWRIRLGYDTDKCPTKYSRSSTPTKFEPAVKGTETLVPKICCEPVIYPKPQ